MNRSRLEINPKMNSKVLVMNGNKIQSIDKPTAHLEMCQKQFVNSSLIQPPNTTSVTIFLMCFSLFLSILTHFRI